MTGRSPLPGPIASLLAARDSRRMTAIGEPHATDLDRAVAAAPLLRHVLRVEQDAGSGPPVGWFTDQVVGQIAELLRAPAQAWRGELCGSLTDATIRTLLPLRHAQPGIVLYRSSAAHPHVDEAAHILGLDATVVAADQRGVLNPSHLVAEIRQQRPPAAVVVATLGTRATGAHDDVSAIRAAAEALPIRVQVHVDAPLEGLALAARAVPQTLVGFDAGADSIVVAGDQFLPVPLPCAVAVRRGPSSAAIHAPAPSAPVITAWAAEAATGYSGGSGHAAVLLWQALQEYGVDGLARRARRSDALAGYTLRRLQELRWPCWRHPGSMTVLLRPPSALLRLRWSLPVEAGWARIVCVPGVTEAHIDRFLAELSHELPPVPAAAAGVAAALTTAPSSGDTRRPQGAASTDVPAPRADHAQSQAA